MPSRACEAPEVAFQRLKSGLPNDAGGPLPAAAEVQDRHGCTPLHLAASRGHCAALALLMAGQQRTMVIHCTAETSQLYVVVRQLCAGQTCYAVMCTVVGVLQLAPSWLELLL